MTITKITEHIINMDFRTESGHKVIVIECPISQKPELATFESETDYFGSCPCGEAL